MERQDELLALRALIEKQKTELAEKERVIEEQKAHIEEQKVHIEEQDSLIARQNIQIENMIQALLHARKKLFGASTEATRQTEGQLTPAGDRAEKNDGKVLHEDSQKTGSTGRDARRSPKRGRRIYHTRGRNLSCMRRPSESYRKEDCADGSGIPARKTDSKTDRAGSGKMYGMRNGRK